MMDDCLFTLLYRAHFNLITIILAAPASLASELRARYNDNPMK